jgi:hypothetical protein
MLCGDTMQHSRPASEINSRIFIDNFSFQYSRWGAIAPEVCVPVLRLRTDCSLFALRYAHSSCLLPARHEGALAVRVQINTCENVDTMLC